MLKILGLDRLIVLILRKLLYIWVRTQVLPLELKSLNIDPDKPICYVLQSKALSSLLVLETESAPIGFPRPLSTLKSGRLKETHSFFFLDHGNPSPLNRQSRYAPSPRLKRLVDSALQDKGLDVQLVPITILWGRAPDKEESLLKIVFADTWSATNPIRQLLMIFLHGRNTIVKVAEPISLREIVDDSQGPELAVRKALRLLRTHFRRQKEVALGPDLSHRRTQINSIVEASSVQQAILAEANESNTSLYKVEDKARRYAWEISADYSYSTIRALDLFLTWLWTKLYDGVQVHRIEEVASVAEGKEIIYVPCHRSHIDYLLLSYVIHRHGMMVPHIAAGANLNLPVVGGILRRGGAFFLRRSFKGNNLYAAVFNEYLHMMIQKGFPIEYFVEGGRSRTGRLLSPRAGMLAMTVQSFLRDHSRPIVFVPVYFGYEKLMEGGTYVQELSGKPKQKESLWGVIKTLRSIQKTFGKVHVNFGQPISLGDYLDGQHPEWKEDAVDPNTKTPWLVKSVDKLADQIVTHINSAAVVNPVNMMALTLLATPKHAMDATQLARQIEFYQHLLRSAPYSDRIEVTNLSGQGIIAYCEGLKLVHRIRHPLGDLVSLLPEPAVLMTYFRNNSLHLFAIPSLIACYLVNNHELTREELKELVSTPYPFLQTELFLHWPEADLEAVIERYLDVLIAEGMVSERPGSNMIKAPPITSSEFMQLRVLSQSVRQTLTRYYMTIALITQQGSGKTDAKRLEELSHLLAQRLSILYEFNTPEFFDKAIFKGFIATMRERGLIGQSESGTLTYDERLQDMSAQSLYILPGDVRETILQITQVDEQAVEAALAATQKKS